MRHITTQRMKMKGTPKSFCSPLEGDWLHAVVISSTCDRGRRRRLDGCGILTLWKQMVAKVNGLQKEAAAASCMWPYIYKVYHTSQHCKQKSSLAEKRVSWIINMPMDLSYFCVLKNSLFLFSPQQSCFWCHWYSQLYIFVTGWSYHVWLTYDITSLISRRWLKCIFTVTYILYLLLSMCTLNYTEINQKKQHVIRLNLHNIICFSTLAHLSKLCRL